MLFLHGLATPDVLLPEQAGDQTPLLAFAGGATLPVGGAILALAAWPAILRAAARPPPPWPPIVGGESVPTILRLQAVITTGIVVVGAAGIADQNILPSQPS